MKLRNNEYSAPEIELIDADTYGLNPSGDGNFGGDGEDWGDLPVLP